MVHTIFPQIGDAELDAKAKELAFSLGLQYNLPASPTDPHSQGGAGSGALMGEAMQRGVCSVITECGLGYLTQPREEFILNHLEAARNAMRQLGMMVGEPVYQHADAGPQRYLDNRATTPAAISPPVRPVASLCVVLTLRCWVATAFVKAFSPASGVFTALRDQGDLVEEGEVIGRVGGLDGGLLGDVLAPIGGVVHEMYPERVVVVRFCHPCCFVLAWRLALMR